MVHPMENMLVFYIKLNIEFSGDPIIPLLGIYTQDN